MTEPIQFELAWEGREAPPWDALTMLRKGDLVSLNPALTPTLPAAQRGRVRLARDLRGHFVPALAAGLDPGDDALVVTLDDWRAAWRGERPCPYDTVVYIELPEIAPLSAEDKATATFGPTVWSRRSGCIEEIAAWSAWTREHGLLASRFVFDVPHALGEVADFVAVLCRALHCDPVGHVAVACRTVTHAQIYAGLLSDLLASLGRRGAGIRIVSCPTCARCRIDMRTMTQRIQDLLPDSDEDLEVAVMGCEVNGPGEARSADVGIAIGAGIVTLFENGRITARFTEQEAVGGFLAAIERRIARGAGDASAPDA